MKVDFKQTIWETGSIDATPEQEALILIAIQEGTITTTNELHSFVEDLTGKEVDWEMNYDSAEDMSRIDNGGAATLEVYNDHNNLIWDNTSLELDDKDSTEA